MFCFFHCLLFGWLNQIESRIVHVAHLEEMKMAFRILVIISVEENSLERHRCIWKDDSTVLWILTL
jgi:hypothetical protein